MTGPANGSATVPAMGGTRLVPQPDRIATDYLLLVLRLDQRIPGLVDGYFGPAALKGQVDMEQLRAPARLRDDALALRERLATEVDDPDRRTWLDAQLVALETHAAALAGEAPPYEDLVTRCMGVPPERLDDAVFAAARAAIDAQLPGGAPLADRLAEWDKGLEIDVDRLPAVIDWLVELFRAGAARDFGLPDGEDLRVGLVTGQPWGAYNWYDGGRRSRVDVNTDLPVRASGLMRMVAHETYPGHHLEHAWKEADLVDRQGRLEASIPTINTPECVISEGLANLGASFAVRPADESAMLVELFERAGLAVARDPAAARATADRCIALAPARRTLDAARGNAALLLHADGWPREAVLGYLADVAGFTPSSAAKRLEFIEHPLWRTYIFVYAQGEAMLRQWVDVVPEPERVARFGRLLHEQVTPATILAEVTPRG
jgi:hypothetical protein